LSEILLAAALNVSAKAMETNDDKSAGGFRRLPLTYCSFATPTIC
jgi:hypothetical protein